MASPRTDYSEDDEYNIKRKIHYDEETGVLFWKFVTPERLGDNYYNTRYAGKVAGRVNKKTGYVHLCVNYKYFRAHRVAWFLVYGYWPEGEIDHINHIRHDNRLCNLRLASRSEQMRNRLKNKNNTSGHNGVRWHSSNSRWYVDIRVGGDAVYLGSFESIDEAVRVRKEAEKRYGFSGTHGEEGEAYE